ncbi:MAG TPA: biotin/lipoyl-containing protein [Blastocatellia bacterium]|nr:biotin/lipoyl-containing protein [Blastocatellia bacterium]
MKVEAEINGRAVTVELEERDGRLTARVGDRAYELGVERPEDNAYLLFVGNEVYESRVWAEETGALRIKLRGHVYQAKIIDRKHRRGAAEQSAEGRQQLIAPMPGKVVRVLCAAGDEVAAGQGVVVVEAMKMQNEIKSPKAGRVTEIRVGEGATVTANQVLAIVE